MSTALTKAPTSLLVKAARELQLPVETVLVVAEKPRSKQSLAYRIAVTHCLRRTLKVSYPQIAYLMHDSGHTTALMRNKIPCTKFCKCKD